MEDLRNASELLLKALEVREKYMKYSHQSFPNLVKRFLMSMGSSGSPLPGNEAYDDGTHSSRATLEGKFLIPLILPNTKLLIVSTIKLMMFLFHYLCFYSFKAFILLQKSFLEMCHRDFRNYPLTMQIMP